MILRHHVPIELVGSVRQVVIELFVLLALGAAVPVRHEDSRLTSEHGPVLGDLRFDAIHVVTDVDAIDHGLLVGVVLDQIASEESDGLFGRRGRQADEGRVEVFEDLTPDVVDTAVAFIDHDEVEHLDGNLGVVDDWQRLLEKRILRLEQRAFFVLFLEVFLTLEHRVESLDRRDADLRSRSDRVLLQMLNAVLLGELVAVDGTDELLELIERLFAQVVSIHQEKDPFGIGVLDEPVAEIDGGEGFAAAGRHLDESTRLVQG